MMKFTFALISDKPDVAQFWSVTRYGADTFLPLNPADIGSHDIQACNAFNTEPDAGANVPFTFSKKDCPEQISDRKVNSRICSIRANAEGGPADRTQVYRKLKNLSRLRAIKRM